jgi:hypothetical protein
VKVSEIFQVETPHAPGGLESVLSAIAASGLVLEHLSTVRRDQARTLGEITLLPDPLDVTVHERISRAVQGADAANGSIGAEAYQVVRPSEAYKPQPEVT